jgi:hypothetical protein
MSDKPTLTTSGSPYLSQKRILTFTRNPLSTSVEQNK